MTKRLPRPITSRRQPSIPMFRRPQRRRPYHRLSRPYTGDRPENAAAGHGIELEVAKLPEAKRGFVLLPRLWVVERSFGWIARFRRLACDYERLAGTLAGMHYLAFVCLVLGRLIR